MENKSNAKKKPSSMYTEALADNFPAEMTITLGKTTLRYRKKQWTIEGKSAGLRYGDNPGQEAALYELADGKPGLGKCTYISPEDAIISNLDEKDIVETGKTIGKSNLTDLDAAINILKYFDEPTALIMKHNN